MTQRPGKKIAVVGSGVSGLVAARLLAPSHDVTLFESEARLGGHVHTVTLEIGSRRYRIDTGFMVFNEPAYPEFTKLLADLGIETCPTTMSFSVRSERERIEYNGGSFRGLFADARTACRPAFLRMLAEIPRFNRAAEAVAPSSDEPLGAFLSRGNFSRALADWYVLPMIAAIWSAPIGCAAEFPTGPLMAFCRNHGLLRVIGRPQWKVVRGGSSLYVERIAAALDGRIRLGQRVVSLRRVQQGVLVRLEGGARELFDDAVVAVHGDEVLGLLENATSEERAAFGGIRYVENDVVLHTDASMLPRHPRARASWNALLPEAPGDPVLVTYDMNRLQGLGAPGAVCVSLNASDRVAPASVVRRFRYRHPLLHADVLETHRRIEALNGAERIHYCGAYLGHGFHEDGVRSAIAVARRIERADSQRALSAA